MTAKAHRLRLLLITDRRAVSGPLVDAVESAVRGGVTAVMVRDPELDRAGLTALTLELAPAVREGGALLLVNDRVDVALETGADGVHLKSTSMPTGKAREILGENRWLGRSTHEPEEVDAAFAAGADYVVFGPVFATPSKEGILAPRGAGLYHRVAARAKGPVLALGGIDARTLPRLAGGPVPGVALIRGILAAPDPEAAARELRAALERLPR